MQASDETPNRHEPTRGEAVTFFVKSRLLMLRHAWRERDGEVVAHPAGNALAAAQVAVEVRAPLWTQDSPAEFPLTAGKVQNLRAAARLLGGVEVAAGEVFSFWKQVGRTTTRKGFTKGRELRSGCMVPAAGGGLCQLSGLLHEVALLAGLEVVERHAHSRTLPGVPLPPERDATIFWNYVDLRFRGDADWRMEVELTDAELVVRLRIGEAAGAVKKKEERVGLTGVSTPHRAAAEGDCHTCGMTSCFRHPSANRGHSPASGHSAFLLDGRWPEFDTWCGRHARPGDRWFTPLDGKRWDKPNYAWSPPPGISVEHAALETLLRAWRQRKLPGQGAVRQRFLLESQRRLALELAGRIDPQARHLVISQTLLPHLWQAGHLGGRSFDVLVNRWPLTDLQARLDVAAVLHPESGTLTDFRADSEIVRAESAALAAAARLITPHRAIAESFGARAILLDWETPVEKPRETTPSEVRWFFPASALGRKGIHEVAAAVRAVGGKLLVLGRAQEEGEDPLAGVSHCPARIVDLSDCTALVIPAWIEHEPRLALRALTQGIPVIASSACGLSPHPLLTEIDAGDTSALREAMNTVAEEPSGLEALVTSFSGD